MRLLLGAILATVAWAGSASIDWQEGPTRVFRGRGASYGYFHIAYSVSTSGVRYFQNISAPSGLSLFFLCPPHTSFACYSYAGPKYGEYFAAANSAGSVVVRIMADATASLGSNSISFDLVDSTYGEFETVHVSTTVEVLDLPALPTPPQRPVRINLPAAAAQWVTDMTTSGATYCTLSPDPYIGYGDEAHVWYYDGGNAYRQIAAYLGDSATWMPCATWLLHSYADYYTGYIGQGWRVFPYGMAWAYVAGWGDKYLNTLTNQATKTYETQYIYSGHLGRIWNSGDGGCWQHYDRELAYALQSVIELEKIDQVRTQDANESRAVIDVMADKLMHYLDNNFFPTHEIAEWQSWQGGLALRALIEYYELTKGEDRGPDPRVPYYVKMVLDWAATHRFSNGVVVNNPFNQGEYCCGNGCYDKEQALDYWITNSFLAPAAAWYWRQSGDAAYAALADDFFAIAANGTIWSGKQWSQKYYWSFDYLRWRVTDVDLLPGSKRGAFRGTKLR